MGKYTITLPCRVGDEVFGIRVHNRTRAVHSGVVTEIYFAEGMQCCIVVKNVCRGIWGKNVFASREEAEAHLGGDSNA